MLYLPRIDKKKLRLVVFIILKQNRCHTLTKLLVPNEKNGFGPFSYKFFVPIRVGLTIQEVFSKKIFLVLYAAYFVVREEGMGWGGKTLMEE